LIAGNDATLLAVSQHRAMLTPHVELGLPDHETVLRCLDKLSLSEAAAGTGLDAPVTITCASLAGAGQAASELGFPVALKSRESVHLLDGRYSKTGSAVVGDAAALARVLPSFGDEYVVQEHVTGPIISCAGVTTTERLLALVVSRYERTWPPEGGNVSASVVIEPPPGVADAVHQLLTRLRWEGIFEVEFVQRADGSLTAIDLNPRPYGSLALAVGAGVSIPAIWCEWVLRGRAAPETLMARPGRRYRWEEAELRNAWRHVQRGRPAAALGVLRPHRDVTHALLEARDPGPFLAGAAYAPLRAWRRRPSRMRGLVRKEPALGRRRAE
jgi:predicted ATP-grasp superfamily ATP-dependent carboligase